MTQVIEEDDVPPDENLVLALGKMGMPLNRARRACVATRNVSREAALAWCVDHADDPGIDMPYLPPRKPAGGYGYHMAADGAGGAIVGNLGCDFGVSEGDKTLARGVEKARAATAVAAARDRRRLAAEGLEAYVRARLSVMRSGEFIGMNGSEGFDAAKVEPSTAAAAEVEELTDVLTSFQQRQRFGQAEERARAVLPSGVDLQRFALDVGYRQVKDEGRFFGRGGVVGREEGEQGD